jgi:hypothetical protein
MPRLCALVCVAAFSARAVLAAPAAAPAHLTEAEALALTREVSASVESIRGLRFERPVTVKLVDDATARKHFQKRLEKFWPPAQVAVEQKVHTLLGLLPPGTDIVERLLDLLEEQAGGYYDPSADTFYILTDMPKAVAPILFSHELTHALDDQHFDLDGHLTDALDDDDRGTAMGAVIEGSGMLVMSVYLAREMAAGRLSASALLELQESEAGKAEKLGAAPPLLQRLLLAPYLLGQSFLLRGNPLAILRGVAPADLDRAFKTPPASTEQLLHPAKYWDDATRDVPRIVKVPDLSERLGAEWKLSAQGNLGELTLAVLTGGESLDPKGPDAVRAESWTNPGAAGWGGDLYQLYEGPQGAAVTALATVWDSPEEAKEFEESLSERAPRLRARRGSVVGLVAGTAEVPKDAQTTLLEAVMAAVPTP